MRRMALGFLKLKPRSLFGYMENGKFCIGIRHRFMTKGARMRSSRKLHREMQLIDLNKR